MSKPHIPTAPDEAQVHYTVLIRLPFPRGDFVDPSPVSLQFRYRGNTKLISRVCSGQLERFQGKGIME